MTWSAMIAAATLSFFTCLGVADDAGVVEVQPVTGADVPEQEVKAILHVSAEHPKSADDNPGTEALPLKSISRGSEMAFENNAKGIGSKVLVAPGVYREAVPIPKRDKNSTDAPVVFEATEPGGVVVSGSDVFTDWQRVEGDENLYWHHWPYKWGPRAQVSDPVWVRCGIFFKPILLRRETVYANGQLLRLVLSPLQLREGTCYVSEADEKLIVWLPRGLDARTALMEVPVRRGLFVVQRQKNIVLRGFTFTHDNSYYELGAACSFSGVSTNFLIEDCRFEWNNSSGCSFNTVRDMTIRRTVSNNNGSSGFAGSRLRNALFEDTENSYNNWRGDWGEYYSWSVGATKFLETKHAVWRRNRSIGNHALGFWFDYDCGDITIDGAWWVGNDRAGIFIEANPGPITIRNSVIAMNEHGVSSTNSSQVTLEGNAFYANRNAQILVQGPRDRPVKTWDWGGQTQDIVLQIDNWSLRHNVLVSRGRSQKCMKIAYSDPDLFVGTLTSERNVWYHADTPRAFSLSGVNMTLDEWRAISGKDETSVFADPGFADPENLDFWVSLDSPVRAVRAPAHAEPAAFDADAAKALLTRKQRELIDENHATPFPSAKGVSAERWHPVDLSALANRPLRGEEGWMGLGGLTLDWLDGGEVRFQGVPFQILDPSDGALSCIALRSNKVRKTGNREISAKVSVPLSKKVSALYFLHGCGWGKNGKVGQYRIVYEDDTVSGVDIIPYGAGSEHLDVAERMRKEATIQDWWPALTQIDNERLRNVIIADPDNPADKRYLYNLQWANPKPAKAVKRIELESDARANTSLFVLAITAILAE